MFEGPVDHIRDGFEAAVGMPGGAFRLAWGVFDFAHLIEVDERVEISLRDAGKGTPNRKAFALETTRRGGDGTDTAQRRPTRIEAGDARKNDVGRSANCWHFSQRL